MQNQSKCEITFDTQLKTALNDHLHCMTTEKTKINKKLPPGRNKMGNCAKRDCQKSWFCCEIYMFIYDDKLCENEQKAT